MPKKKIIKRKRAYMRKKKRYFRNIRPRVGYDKAIKVTFDRQLQCSGVACVGNQAFGQSPPYDVANYYVEFVVSHAANPLGQNIPGTTPKLRITGTPEYAQFSNIYTQIKITGVKIKWSGSEMENVGTSFLFVGGYSFTTTYRAYDYNATSHDTAKKCLDYKDYAALRQQGARAKIKRYFSLSKGYRGQENKKLGYQPMNFLTDEEKNVFRDTYVRFFINSTAQSAPGMGIATVRWYATLRIASPV